MTGQAVPGQARNRDAAGTVITTTATPQSLVLDRLHERHHTPAEDVISMGRAIAARDALLREIVKRNTYIDLCQGCGGRIPYCSPRCVIGRARTLLAAASEASHPH
jgi:hypothetical protein